MSVVVPEIESLDWEMYDGQDTDGYEYIGAVGHPVEPIVDAEEQAEEMYRKFGRRVEIRIYRSMSND